MSALLAKLNLEGCTLLTPDEALQILASRGDWSALAQAVARHIRSLQADGSWPVVGSATTFESLGLSPDDFKRTKASKTKAVGETDYSGITAAARSFGLNVRTTTDGFRAFYVPADPEGMIAKAREARANAAKKAAAKKK